MVVSGEEGLKNGELVSCCASLHLPCEPCAAVCGGGVGDRVKDSCVPVNIATMGEETL
jgi:hypothetical protein